MSQNQLMRRSRASKLRNRTSVAGILLALGLIYYLVTHSSPSPTTSTNVQHYDQSINTLSSNGLLKNTQYTKSSSNDLCFGASGDWCQNWHSQKPIPWRSPPLPTKNCTLGCNFVGVCDAHRGWCRCPAGYTGDLCEDRLKRPCSQNVRPSGSFEPYNKPNNYTLSGLTLRCAGECDEDIGMCFCPSNTKYGRIPNPINTRPGTPLKRYGRPMGDDCQPNKIRGEDASEFGDVDPELLYGEKGWCEADEPEKRCACHIDGVDGEYCDIPKEHFCINQCSGHGDCYLGWCHCHQGYFGSDCAYRMPGVEWTPGIEHSTKPWLKDYINTPSAIDPLPGSTRKRPLIYIYEMNPLFNQLLLQYRIEGMTCAHRTFDEHNETVVFDGWMYSVETGIHEMIAQSEHRTLDPEEADFFFVPMYSACFMFPVLHAGDFPYFHGGPVGNRPQHAVNMMIEAWQWVTSHLPYWDRHGGKDHIIIAAHDEQTCYVPAVWRPAIILGLWGRKDVDHRSNTAYVPDNYTHVEAHDIWHPEDHLAKLGNYSCHDPTKDILIPSMYSPWKYGDSPLFRRGGKDYLERDIFAFFKGDLREKDDRTVYSRGIRQRMAQLTREQDWWNVHRIWIGGKRMNVPGKENATYSQALSSSVFCFVLPGDGWSARFEDAVLHGCIPVVIMDNVDVPYSSALDVSLFSVRIDEKDVERVPQILKGISKKDVARMQENVKKVWNRYHYFNFRPYFKEMDQMKEDGFPEIVPSFVERNEENELRHGFSDRKDDGDEGPLFSRDDAFSTLIQILHSKIID